MNRMLDALNRLKRTNCKLDINPALLDINPAQTDEEFAEQLGVTQQTISIRLHTMGKVQKEGRWVPHELSEDNKIIGVTLHSLSKFRKKIFCTKSLQAMKSGFFMITLNVENHGLTLVNLPHRRQSPISTPRRFCSVSGGIGKVCCITSCYNRVKQSRQTATNNN
ncbi:hypothetical protein P5V15_004387 [Pogonomyrmex californicus]